MENNSQIVEIVRLLQKIKEMIEESNNTSKQIRDFLRNLSIKASSF